MQSGEACVPELLVDPCVEYSTALQLTCPQNNVDLSYLPDASDILPRARCRVCGFGQVGRDQDPRKGYYESDIYFGQNSIESVINEDPIVEYRVYLVDELNRRVTRALAVVPKDPEESQCCRVDSYRAHIFTVLPTGYKRFLVVPVSLFGTEMPAGTLSDEIEDHERGGDYDLGILPVRNFSFLVNVVDEMKAGNGSLTLRSTGHQVEMECTRLRLLQRSVVVPVLAELQPGESYEVLLDRECLITPSTNVSVDLVSPAHGLRFRTVDENVTDEDTKSPSLLDSFATNPQNGALQAAREFHLFFDEVALKGPGPLALVRLPDLRGPATVVDDDPIFRSILGVPGMVVVRPRQPLEPGASYELVFGPGAVQDAMGNMAHSSKEFQERGEWEHRVACFFGDCGETPAFGLDDYIIRVPAEGAQVDASVPWALLPKPGETIFKHQNLVLEFMQLASPGRLDRVFELCSNWTITDVCPMKRVLSVKDMIFVGRKVIINPPQDLDPGYSYNVSIQSDVIANLESFGASSNGHFAYTFSIAPEVPDRRAPELLAVEVVCEEVNGSTFNALDHFGCGVWNFANHISGEPPTWGYQGRDVPVALPISNVARFRFIFGEPVQLEGGAIFLWTSETGSPKQEVPAFVGVDAEDSVVTTVPDLLPGYLYTLELGKGIKDLATWPEPNPFEGVALNFYTHLGSPEVRLASNEGLKEADATSVIKLCFEGPARLADPSSDLEVEIVQVNPPSDYPDSQRLRVSDPGTVVFLRNEVLFLPRPLLAGTSYRFTLPAGSVLHFDEPFSFLFATRSEDLMPPSIVWTWPTGTVSKLTIDRMLVQIYFSEAVQPSLGKFITLRDDRGTRYPLPVDAPCLPDESRGCMHLDMEGRRLSLLPNGRAEGEMVSWATPGRTYVVEIEEEAFSDAVTVGELRKNFLAASSFSFSIHPDTEGPVLSTSEPQNHSGDVDPILQSLLLVFDEVVEAVESDVSVSGRPSVRPLEAPELEMLPGEMEVNPEMGFVVLTFNVDVEVGSGFFHLLVRSDTPTIRGNTTEYDSEVIKEVPVEEVFFVRNYVMLNPFPMPLGAGATFFVGSNQTAVMASNGRILASELDTLEQAGVQFRVAPTLLRVVFTTWRDWLCFNKIMDIELYMNEHIVGLNTSERAITLRDPNKEIVWRFWADEQHTDHDRLQVTLDPAIPFKATIHLSQLPATIRGGTLMPLPAVGGVYAIEVDEGLFLDRPEQIEENVTVPLPLGATCGDFNFSCGPGRELVQNATHYRCAAFDYCNEDDNITCCQDLPLAITEMNTTTEAPCVNDSNCSNETMDGSWRRLMELDPGFRVETTYYDQVFASPMFSFPWRACETRYEDLEGRTARVYVPLEVQRSEINGQLRPQLFEVYIPTTMVQDVLGNIPQEPEMLFFSHDLRMPELDLLNCHPLNGRNATEQESIQLRFTEEIKPGVGFFELWDIEDTTGPKLRVDVEMLAAANPEHFGRKLIDGNTVSLIPDLLCAGGCQELESGITYFLMTSNAGVVYDMMDNPLPMLDTNRSRSWSFYVNENVTRAPEVLRTSFAINSTEAVTEVHGYLYFAQRVFQNGSFPDTVRQASEIQIQDCGADFDCSHSQVVEPVTVQVEPWSSQRLGLEPGLVHFSFEVPDVPHRFQVTVLPWSFMGADTRKGSLAGPSQPYTFMLETGSDPSIPPERPFILPGGVFPSGPEPVTANSNVTMVFSEEVLAGSGNISFCVDLVEDRCSLGRFADGSWATLELSAATVERRKVTWQLEEFAFGQSLQILMPEGLFLSADDRRVPVSYSSGEYRFRIREGDVMPPQVIAIEATERRNGTVQMIFSEAVLFEGDMGNEGVLELATSKGMADFHATVDGAVVTIHGPFATGESYGLRYAAEAALMDLANNRAISVPMDSEIFAISDDTEGPEAHLPVPHLLQMHEVFYIMFDEPVHPGLSHCQLESLPPSYCGLTCGRSEVLVNLRAMVHHFEQGGHMRSMIQVDPGRYLLPGVEYRLTVQPGFIEDSVGNLCEGVEATYKVDLRRDLIPPQLLLATINGHGGPVPSFDQDRPGAGLELYFSEVLQPWPGTMKGTILHLLPSDGGNRCAESGSACEKENCHWACNYLPASQSITIAADLIEIRGATAVLPSAHLPFLEYGRGYRLVVEVERFQDLAGNPAMGAGDSLVFQVARAQAESTMDLTVLASLPMDGQTMVPMTSSLQLVFDRMVQAGPGHFLLLPEIEVEMDESNRSMMCQGACNESTGNESAIHMNDTNHSESKELDLSVNDSDLVDGNVTNETEMPAAFDPNVVGAIHVPAQGCHVQHTTVTCTLPSLAQGMEYKIYWTHGALQDEEGLIRAGPSGVAPGFRVIDRPSTFPTILSLLPSSKLQSGGRRLDDFAMEPKPPWYAAKGATLALTFSSPVKLGMGRLRLVDCSPGNSLRCYDGRHESVADEEVLAIEVSAKNASEQILLDGRRALVVSQLRPGRRHALRIEHLGVFVDEVGNPLLPVVSGFEFQVQADDERAPEIFMQAPTGVASTNSNITLFFSEALQADMNGVINISDGLQEELVNLSTPSSTKGEGYAIVRNSVVIINPAYDFGYSRDVTVNIEPGVFKDLAGNPFPGFGGNDYVFRSAPSRFERMAAYLRYPNFREPRFTPREGAMVHFVNGTLLLYGGLAHGDCLADTWVSKTGEDWEQVTGVLSQDHTRLFPLVAHSPTVVDKEGCIWVLGGECNNDPGTLWKTCDVGRSWFYLARPTPIPFSGQVPPKFPTFFRDHAMAILGGWQLIVVDASPGSSESVWRFNSPAAERVQRVAGENQLPFGLRREPKLMATSEGGLFLVGGHLCARVFDDHCNFNDVWFSPDIGESWHCQTKSYLAKDPSFGNWPGVGQGFAAVITQDDTIFVMAGDLPSSQEASAFMYESYLGLQDTYLTDQQPYLVQPGSVYLDQPPVPPTESFTLLFGEEVRTIPESVAFFYEQPGNYSDLDNDTNYSTGLIVEASILAHGKDLRLMPTELLRPGRRYLIEIPAGQVQDAVGNTFGRMFGDNLQVEILEDFEAPFFISMHPTDGRTDVEPWTQVTLTMSENVFAGHGSLKVKPMRPYGAEVHLPVHQAKVVLNKVMFRLPPGQRFTPDMEYEVSMPQGLLRDRFGNEARGQRCGEFRTLSGFFTTNNYAGEGIPRVPEPPPEEDLQEGFPRLLATWPFNGATDVPARPGMEVFLYFEEEVRWTWDGVVHFFNETHLMASIPTREYHLLRNNSRLQPLPSLRAVKISLPASAVLRPTLRYQISLSEGSLEDFVLGNRSAEIRLAFNCLQNSYGGEGPKLVAADVSSQQEVMGSKHVFRFWYNEDIVKTTDQKPPVQLELPTGQIVEVPGDSPNVTIDRNVMTVVFPEHVMSFGGLMRLRVPRFIFVDAFTRTNNVIEGGGQPTASLEELRFTVTREDDERPLMNTSHCYPPLEETPIFEFPHNGRILLAFTKEVKSGPGSITFVPRSFGAPNVSVPGRSATTAGHLAMIDLALHPGEVYNVTVDADAFLDVHGYSMLMIDDSYVFSTRPLLRFRQMGSQQWGDPALQVPGGRLAPSVTVDDVNRIFLLGGRTSQRSSLQGAYLNDVWMLNTFKEVNCASAFEGETACSRERCEAPNGVFTLGEQHFARFVWRRRSVLGSECITSSGHRRSELNSVIDRRSLQCPCPTCTSHPGPPDGPPLPVDMLNDYYVQAYTLVPSDDTRPLLCAPGLTPTGNFSCKLFDRYFAIFETPYPTCENSSCEEPPDTSEMTNFAAWDPARSTDNLYCPNISTSNRLPHGGLCAALCEPGWKVDSLFRCEQGKFQAPTCWRQSCPIESSLGSGRLDCEEYGGPYFGATCKLLCDPGYQWSNLQSTCQTFSTTPEAAPTFHPNVSCTPSSCGDYGARNENEREWLVGASIVYADNSREITATATLTCSEGYFPAGSAFGLEGSVELRCGPVVDKENEPEVEWKLTYTGARAGRICAPEGMAIYDTIILRGSIGLTLILPAQLTQDSLCGQYKDRFIADLGLALVMALSAAGKLKLEASSVSNVELGACPRVVRLRRLATGQSVETTVSFIVEVNSDEEAEDLQDAVLEPDSSDVFKRVFSLALMSSSGINATGIQTSRLTRDISYKVGECLLLLRRMFLHLVAPSVHH